MQQTDEAAGGDPHAEPRPQQAGGPWPAARPSRCATRQRGRRARGQAAPRPPRGRRGSGGGGGPARAADTASSSRPRCRSGARWADSGELFVETARRRGSLRRPHRSRDTPSAPAPCGSRRPSAGSVGNPVGRTAARPVGRAACRTLAAGPWPVVWRRGGPHGVASSCVGYVASSGLVVRALSTCTIWRNLVPSDACRRPGGFSCSRTTARP